MAVYLFYVKIFICVFALVPSVSIFVYKYSIGIQSYPVVYPRCPSGL